MVVDMLLRVFCLRLGVVGIPFDIFVRIPGVIIRLIVVVLTFKHFPIFKSLTAPVRDIVGPAVPIYIPLADIGGVVNAGFKGLGYTGRAVLQADVVNEDAVRQRILAGLRRRPCR